MKILPTELLFNLTEKRLRNVLKSARIALSQEVWKYGNYGMCCGICCEWILTKEEFQEKVTNPTNYIREYIKTIKNVLKSKKYGPNTTIRYKCIK